MVQEISDKQSIQVRSICKDLELSDVWSNEIKKIYVSNIFQAYLNGHILIYSGTRLLYNFVTKWREPQTPICSFLSAVRNFTKCFLNPCVIRLNRPQILK